MVSTKEAMDQLTSLRAQSSCGHFRSRDDIMMSYDDSWMNFSKTDFNNIADNCNDEKEANNDKLFVMATSDNQIRRRKKSIDLCEITTNSLHNQSSRNMLSKDDSFIDYNSNWAHFSNPNFNFSTYDDEEDKPSVMEVAAKTQKKKHKSTKITQSQRQKSKTDESINYFPRALERQPENHDKSSSCLLNYSDVDDCCESSPKASTDEHINYFPTRELGKLKDERGVSSLDLLQNMEADSDDELSGPSDDDKANMKKEVASLVEQLKKSNSLGDFFGMENQRSEDKIQGSNVKAEQDFDVDTIISGIRRNRRSKKAMDYATECTKDSHTQKSLISASCGSLLALKKSQHLMLDPSHTMHNDYSNFASSLSKYKETRQALNDSKKKTDYSTILLKFSKEMEENSTTGSKKKMDYSNLILNRMNKLKSEIESNDDNQDELSKPKLKQIENLDDFVSTFMHQHATKTKPSNADGATSGTSTTINQEPLMNAVKFSGRRIRGSIEKPVDYHLSAPNLKSGRHSSSKPNEIRRGQQSEYFSSSKSNEKRNSIDDQLSKTVHATTRTRISQSMKMKMAADIVLCAASKTELSMPKRISAGNRNRMKSSLTTEQINASRLKEKRSACVSQTMKMKPNSDLDWAQGKRGEMQQKTTKQSIAKASPTRGSTSKLTIDQIHSKMNKSGNDDERAIVKGGKEELANDKREQKNRRNDAILDRSRHTTRNREFEKSPTRRSTKTSPTRVSTKKMTPKQTQSNMSKGTNLDGSRHTCNGNCTEKSLTGKSTKRISTQRASKAKMTKDQPHSNMNKDNIDEKFVAKRGTESISNDEKQQKIEGNELELNDSRHSSRAKERRCHKLDGSSNEEQRRRESTISNSDNHGDSIRKSNVSKKNRNHDSTESSIEPRKGNPSNNLVESDHQSKRGRQSASSTDINDRKGQSKSRSNSKMRNIPANSHHEQISDSHLDSGNDHSKSLNRNLSANDDHDMKCSNHKVQNSREDKKCKKINESKHINQNAHKTRSTKNKKSEKRNSRSPVPPSDRRSRKPNRSSRDHRPRSNSKSRREKEISHGHTLDESDHRSRSSSISRKSTTSKSQDRRQSRKDEINSSYNSKGNTNAIRRGENNELSSSSYHTSSRHKMRIKPMVLRSNSMRDLSMNTKKDLTTLELHGGSNGDSSFDMSSTMTNQVLRRYSVRRNSEI